MFSIACCTKVIAIRSACRITVIVSATGIGSYVVVHFCTTIFVPAFPSGIAHPGLYVFFSRNYTVLCHGGKRAFDSGVGTEAFVIRAFPADAVQHELLACDAESHIRTLVIFAPGTEIKAYAGLSIFAILGDRNSYVFRCDSRLNHDHVIFCSRCRKGLLVTYQRTLVTELCVYKAGIVNENTEY